ncbi:Uncharacterized protein DBV15_09971 [Temnothorax longispinosus]|uniref:Uncharacterized protein n=1 Tax=Temnothorax longispinosus TaxID=300112 RepID=A0A4S2KFJ6_9HYME|nr:Uncharacterized protein DBV15_09971 [Temnothorax longispinosus]
MAYGGPAKADTSMSLIHYAIKESGQTSSKAVSEQAPEVITTIFVAIKSSREMMLSPGQNAPPSNYSSGNVVLQGAPCSQCRDLCPAGYVPHFWR